MNKIKLLLLVFTALFITSCNLQDKNYREWDLDNIRYKNNSTDEEILSLADLNNKYAYKRTTEGSGIIGSFKWSAVDEYYCQYGKGYTFIDEYGYNMGEFTYYTFSTGSGGSGYKSYDYKELYSLKELNGEWYYQDGHKYKVSENYLYLY